MTKYAPKIPLTIYANDDFDYISDLIPNIRQNFKMLLLTNPGEKIMDPSFGVGIRNYLFELKDGAIDVTSNDGNKEFFVNNLRGELLQIIKNQVAAYMPDITINSIDIVTEDNLLYLKINFSYLNFLTSDLLVR